MDIYSILSSKPHNPHYLNRYITFIKQCQQKNVGYEGYTEDHHICPKADDMFPEYKDFRQHPWNCAVLTARQHYIAHLILWKAFYKTNSCKESLWFMSIGKWKQFSNYSKVYEKLKIDLLPIRKKQGKKLAKYNLNSVPVFDPILNKVIKINKSDPRYENGDLKHHSTGHRVGKNDDGEIIYAPAEDERFRSGKFYSLNKGMVAVKNEEGIYFQVSKSDPRFISGELKHNSFGTVWITDGKNEKMIDKDSEIPENWSKGRITNPVKNKIWIKNEKTKENKRIDISEYEIYAALGFKKGRNSWK